MSAPTGGADRQVSQRDERRRPGRAGEREQRAVADHRRDPRGRRDGAELGTRPREHGPRIGARLALDERLDRRHAFALVAPRPRVLQQRPRGAEPVHRRPGDRPPTAASPTGSRRRTSRPRRGSRSVPRRRPRRGGGPSSAGPRRCPARTDAPRASAADGSGRTAAVPRTRASSHRTHGVRGRRRPPNPPGGPGREARAMTDRTPTLR